MPAKKILVKGEEHLVHKKVEYRDSEAKRRFSRSLGSTMDTSQYRYAAMSNLVLQADRRARRSENEPNGEPESLVGRIDPRQMGDRLQNTRSKPAANERGLDRTLNVADLGSGAGAAGTRKRKRVPGGNRGRPGEYSSVLDATEGLEGLTYRPRTAETTQTYEHILAFVHEALGDQTHEIIRSASDVVLETLKDDERKDFDKKKDIDSILGTPLSSQAFAQLTSLGKKITDYAGPEVQEAANEGMDVDGEQDAVAVVVDEDEDEDNGLYAEAESEQEPSDQEEDTGLDQQEITGAAASEQIDTPGQTKAHATSMQEASSKVSNYTR